VALLISCLVIGLFVSMPLLPGFPRFTYKALLRILISNGIFWIALMIVCRWLFPGLYAPSERQNAWNYGPISVEVSLRLTLFFTLIAAGLGPILLWVEYRFYRLAPSLGDRSHLRADAILVAIYLAIFITFVQVW
jgi:hypothetical protein